MSRFCATVAVLVVCMVVGPAAAQTGGAMVLLQQLAPARSGVHQGFGSSVAVSGDLLVVGTRCCGKGAADVYLRRNGRWILRQQLLPRDGALNDYFGGSVVVLGSSIAVGAPAHTVSGNLDQGTVYIFKESHRRWTQEQELTVRCGATGGSGGGFGSSLAVSGETLVVGAPFCSVKPLDYRGAVYVFRRSGGIWKQEQVLTSLRAIPYANLGWSVAIHGSTIAAGAPGYDADSDPSTLTQGAAYIFARSDGRWRERQKLSVSRSQLQAWYGASVGLDRSTLVVGATYYNANAGAAFVYGRDRGRWHRVQELNVPVFEGEFGASVAISGDLLAVGATGPEIAARPYHGAVYTFHRVSRRWRQMQKLEPKRVEDGAQFGASLALDGPSVVSGAPGSNKAYVFSPKRGAATPPFTG